MPKNPPEDMPRISPYLLYEDVGGTMEWLRTAFGLRPRHRMTGPGGMVQHADMEFEGGVVMMGCPGPDYRNPKHTGHRTQELYIYVDDVDAHFRRAREAGAQIIEEPADQPYGDRRYRCLDPEGHAWCFAQRVREMEGTGA